MFNFGDDPPMNVDPKRQGFVYVADITDPDTMAITNEQRILKSNAAGFVDSDKKHAKNDYGTVDWTDGVTLLVWHGAVSRYSVPWGDDKIVYKNGAKLNYAIGVDPAIAGVCIAGAAYKDGVMLIFSTVGMTIHWYFLMGKTVKNSGTIIGDYHLKQVVAVSADCTKASFIALSGDEKTLDVVDLAIVIDTVNHVYTATVSNTTNQDIEDHTDYLSGSYTETVFDGIVDENGMNNVFVLDYDTGYPFIPLYPDGRQGYIYSPTRGRVTRGVNIESSYRAWVRDEKAIITAVDYANNVRKDFTITTSASLDYRQSSNATYSEMVQFADTYYPWYRWDGMYNGGFGAQGRCDELGNLGNFGDLYAVNILPQLLVNYISTIDMNGIVRTTTAVPLHEDTNITTLITGTHWEYNFIDIHTLDLRYGICSYTDFHETFDEKWNESKSKFNQTKSFHLKINGFSYDYRMNYTSSVDAAGATNEFFYQYAFHHGIYSDSTYKIPVYTSPFLINVTAMSMTDKFSHKLFKLNNYLSKTGFYYDLDTPVFIKIDKDNTITPNTITNLKGFL